MDKNFRHHIRNINMLVNYATASAQIKKLEIEQAEGSVYSLRPQIHVILRAPTGEIKSTILRLIGNSIGIGVEDEITSPGLVGTITKQMMFVPGAAWQCRNSLLLLDEFKFRRKSDDWIVFLKLLEDQVYSKKIAMFSASLEEVFDDLYLKVKDGRIRMKTRFAAVVATMKRFEFYRGDNFQAFMTRCIPYEYAFSIDDLEYILSGKKFVKVSPPKVKEEIVVKYRKYMKLMKFVKKNLPANYSGKANFARGVGDIVRLHAITNNINKRDYKNVLLWKVNAFSKIGSYYKREKNDNAKP